MEDTSDTIQDSELARKEELSKQMKEQNVAIDELSNLKKGRGGSQRFKKLMPQRLYHPLNLIISVIFTGALDEMKKEYQKLENSEKMKK
ncbi:hypothetical protein scyTo_0001738 [Scyliorhinus torazame]|uniref:t-SNARE coiled-coil homology domain-containing protein n=1 Tax=Scyliorhinus torazame TaxID=75743 RepID=A0A401PFL9_SCYTO|nr:hypothetical protein [Scyliorhinus torazame]